MESTTASLFLAHSTKKLHQMSANIEACVGKLNHDQLWSRGGPNENSVGNLILHLCGNARQWIVSGVGGAADTRDRDREFAVRGGMTAADLLSHLRETVGESVVVLNTVTAERLTEEINPQNTVVSVLEAIYQVVGHFQQHTGQIIFATKIYSGEDLGLYRPPAR